MQSRIKKNIKAASTGRIYLFTGLIRCPCCGRILTGCRIQKTKAGEEQPFRYKCSRRFFNVGINICQFSRTIGEPRIERYLLDNIQSLLKEHIHNIEVSRAQQRKNDPEAALKAVNEKLRRLKDIYLDGMIDKEDYEADYVALKKKAAELSVLIDKSPSFSSSVWKEVESADFRETYNSLTRENKRRFWQSLISSITFEDTPESRGKNGKFVFHVDFL